MKSLILFFIFCLAFYLHPQTELIAQKKTKKIEKWKIYHSYTTWFYCYNNQEYDPYCVEKVSLTFTNYSKYHISRLTIKLKVYNENDRLIYNRKHTIQLELDPGETGNCKVFKLYERLYIFDGFDDTTWEVEVLSII